MIQRIQSIWLILALLGSVLLCLTASDVVVFNIDLVAVVLGVSSALLCFISLFSFKYRKRQILLNNFSIVINALLIGLLVYWLLSLPGGIQLPEKGIEPLFPLLSILCLFIANLYIRKDEKLVKSVDRLR